MRFTLIRRRTTDTMLMLITVASSCECYFIISLKRQIIPFIEYKKECIDISIM